MISSALHWWYKLKLYRLDRILQPCKSEGGKIWICLRLRRWISSLHLQGHWGVHGFSAQATLFVELEKAPDRSPHRILLAVLGKYRVPWAIWCLSNQSGLFLCTLCTLCTVDHILCGFSVASPGLFLITNSALKFHGQNCHSWEATDEVAYSVHKTINQQLWSYLTLLSVILCKLLPKCTNVMLRGSDQLRGVRNGASLGRGHHRKQTRSSGCYHYFENTLKNWYMYVRMKWELFWKI